jgi:hypothetical protein
MDARIGPEINAIRSVDFSQNAGRKWTLFKEEPERLLHLNFLYLHSSTTMTVLATLGITIAFGIFTFFDRSDLTYPTLTTAIQMFRLTFILCGWIYCYFLKQHGMDQLASNHSGVVICGNSVVVFHAVASSVLLCFRCWIHKCQEGQSKDECSPVADERRIPIDCLLMHALLVPLLPAIYKLHDAWSTVLSWVIATSGVAVGAYLVQASLQSCGRYAYGRSSYL